MFHLFQLSNLHMATTSTHVAGCSALEKKVWIPCELTWCVSTNLNLPVLHPTKPCLSLLGSFSYAMQANFNKYLKQCTTMAMLIGCQQN